MKKVSGTLKLDLAQYRAMEAFAMFASDLDATSRRQLARGQRLIELLKQPQYSPYPVEEQIVSIWAGTTGKLDEVPVEDVLRFEREFLDYLRRESKVLDTIRETGLFDDDTPQAVDGGAGRFKQGFHSEGDSCSAGRRGGRGAGRGRRRAGTDRQAEAGLIDRCRPVCGSCASGKASVSTIKKLTRAMELIAASRIGKARSAPRRPLPYARAITRAVSAVATFSNVDHPLTTEKPNPKPRRGAGDHLRPRPGRRLLGQRDPRGRAAEPAAARGRARRSCPYLVGRKGIAYFDFRHREFAQSWTGDSDNPSSPGAREIGEALIEAFLTPTEEGGVDEIHVVFTRFESMVTQAPTSIRLLPLEVVEEEAPAEDELLPLYEFEPAAEDVLDALLPKYIAAGSSPACCRPRPPSWPTASER